MRFNSKLEIIENVIYEGVEAVLFKKGYRVIIESIKTVDKVNMLERFWLKKNKKYGDKEFLTRAPIDK